MPPDLVDQGMGPGHLQDIPQTLTFAIAYGRQVSDTDFDIDDEHDDDYAYVPTYDVSH
jgi:hypothetical protein